MRFLLKVQIPMHAGNKVAREGTLASTMQSILGELKPEAAYFTAVATQCRTCPSRSCKDSSRAVA